MHKELSNRDDLLTDLRFNQHFKQMIRLLSSALYNCGAEHEQLGDDPQECLKCYLRAFSFSNKYLGAKHSVTVLI